MQMFALDKTYPEVQLFGIPGDFEPLWDSF